MDDFNPQKELKKIYQNALNALEVAELKKEKDKAYWERNQLVAALSKVYPAYLTKHEQNDKSWDEDWRTIVTIKLPTGVTGWRQAAWHIHDSEIPNFDHLEYSFSIGWDGHTSEEKYKRLRAIPKAW